MSIFHRKTPQIQIIATQAPARETCETRGPRCFISIPLAHYGFPVLLITKLHRFDTYGFPPQGWRPQFLLSITASQQPDETVQFKVQCFCFLSKERESVYVRVWLCVCVCNAECAFARSASSIFSGTLLHRTLVHFFCSHEARCLCFCVTHFHRFDSRHDSKKKQGNGKPPGTGKT